MSGEAEPRRSVRATKGQHTKSFDELEPAAAPKRRQTKKTKKAQEQEQEHDQEDQDQDQGQDAEVIRCVCGATEQDEDSGEAWISCETCFAWQHNVCVGVSSYEDEIPENYWCEQCRPENHKELLEGMARGEKPWEARRKAHEEESKKKRKGGRKAKGKRNSDPKDELDKDGRAKSKASPTPEAGAKEKSDSATAPKQGKRKSREDSHDTDGKTPKLRRVSENEAVPVGPQYTPPEDLATSISELTSTRVGPAKALKKSLAHVLGGMVKNGELEVPADSSVDAMAETYALQIERAVLDTHPASKGLKEYGQQIKSLTFNLKNNPELCHGLVRGIHTPPTLAVMTSDQLASAELQRQTAEMKARAEKQSILYTGETGPRVRRTHKGEEVVEDESAVPIAEVPPPIPGGSSRRTVPHLQQPQQHIKHESIDSPQGDSFGQHSPSNLNFDIGKVFSSVKSSSPGAPGQLRRTSSAAPINGPGIDPDVDRMLQDDGDDYDNDSPPYSPTEEAPPDPDVVWRGTLAMSSIADFQATAKHVGGANFANIQPWSKLMPKRMTVAGRIQQQSAIEYLCSLRYSTLTDVVVVSISPVSADSQPEFNALVDYFVSKKRYGVIGDKVAGNVRDTYLVPVPPGDGGHPEFMLNLVDNFLPKTRTEPMLLAVFVYRNEPEQLKQQQQQQPKETTPTTAPAVQQTPVPIPVPGGAAQNASSAPAVGGGFAQRSNSVSAGPAFSPATPQGPGFPTQSVSTTPVPIPQPPHTNRPPQPPTPSASVSASATPALAPTPTPQHHQQQQQQQQQQLPHAPVQPFPAGSPPAAGPMSDAQKYQAQAAGQKLAQEVLGHHMHVPTAQFLLPQAFQMSRREWEIIKDIYERDTRAREDLKYLGVLLEKQGTETKAL